MGAGKSSEAPRFNINGRYTKSEFIEICRGLAMSPNVGAGLARILLEEIKWVEGLEEGAVIGWFERQDGTICPYVGRGELMVGRDDGSMEVNGQPVDDWLSRREVGPLDDV